MTKFNIGIINIPDDICCEYTTFLDNLELYEYLILYPKELKGEKILEDNKSVMLKVIREYINESEMYQRCMDKSKEFYFDSQKQVIINEAYEHQRKADKIAEKMNKGISPYAWYYRNGFIGYIDGNKVSCDYVICLEKVRE